MPPKVLALTVDDGPGDYGAGISTYLAGLPTPIHVAFFQNGNQWIDNNVSAQNDEKSVRIKFGSDEYFALLEQHPEARPWLALGQNVKVLLNSTVYDIYDDSTGNANKS